MCSLRCTTVEQRRILQAPRDDIFTVELEEEYNAVFASIRYAFSEQSHVDWAFKTSFVKAQHNVDPREDITFNNDNLKTTGLFRRKP